MPFDALPTSAAFEHRESRAGYEVVFLRGDAAAPRVEGHASAVLDGEPLAVAYAVELDAGWRTRHVRMRGWSRAGVRDVVVAADGEGAWRVDGERAAQLDGCLDLDLELSSLTNAFPVRRLALEVGGRAEAPAAWVRALDLRVERLEQSYERLADTRDGDLRVAYAAPDLGFEAELRLDRSGLVLAYPGIAVRAA